LIVQYTRDYQNNTILALAIPEPEQHINILIESQHGFRTERSCITQNLIILTEDILFALDHQKLKDIILLDFSKAFYTVVHQRLLTKLRHY